MKIVKLTAFNVVLGSSLLLVSSQALSYQDSAYIGVQLGYGWSNLNDSKSSRRALDNALPGLSQSFSNSTTTGGVGGRVYGGYMVNEFLGVEAGFAAYAQGKSTADIRIGEDVLELDSKNRVTAIDLLGVYRLPVYDRVSVDFKAGIAYVMSKYQVNSSFNGGPSVKEGSQSASTLRPKFAVGADYALSDNLFLGAAYEITPGNGEPFNAAAVGNSNYSPRLQLFTLGVRYDFQ